MDERRLDLIVDEILDSIKERGFSLKESDLVLKTEAAPGVTSDHDRDAGKNNDIRSLGKSEGAAEADDGRAVGNDENFEVVVDNKLGINLTEPKDLGALIRMKNYTTARIGVGKAGARLKTNTMLKLRADHAAARDAVFTDVDKNVLEKTGLKTFSTVVKDKNEFLTRPDLGKKFDSKTLGDIADTAGTDNDVLIYAADGLSSTAINANIQNILPVLVDGLKQKSLKVADPFYVRFGRVGSEDPIAEATRSKVVCVLIGERPGLATAESMSAYICYGAYVGQPESRRTVVSNIHKGGTVAIEAGAYIVDVIEEILNAKVSGVELKKQGDKI